MCNEKGGLFMGESPVGIYMDALLLFSRKPLVENGEREREEGYLFACITRVGLLTLPPKFYAFARSNETWEIYNL